MRSILLGVLAVGTLAAQTAITNASVSGMVKDKITGKPLANYSVSTAVNVTWVGDTVVQTSKTKNVAATTDASGRYRLDDLPPGPYRISAREAQRFGSDMIRHVAVNGSDVSNIDFLVTIEGALTGKVVDENKEPVPGVNIRLITKEYYLGQVGYYYTTGGARTNDLGEYTIARVPPGKPYLLMVDQVELRLPAHSEVPLNPKLRKRVPVRSWYPNSPSRDGAQALVLRPGETREGVDIEMKKAASYCVDGTAIGPGGTAAMRFSIEAMQPSSGTSGGGGSFAVTPSGLTAADGRFRICDLYPGAYRLSAQDADQNSQNFSYGTLDLTVTDRDIEGVRVIAAPGKPLEGEVAWDGDPPANPPTNKVQVSLTPLFRTGFASERSGGSTVIPGPFTIGTSFDDDYSVRAFFYAPGIYIKEITYSGHSVMYEPLRAGSAMSGAGMRVTMAHDGGTVSVQVNDKDGNPAVDLRVLLLPADIRTEGELSARLVQGQTNQLGQYTSQTLRPGKYFAVAIDDTVDRTPESIGRLWRSRTRFKEVELPPGGSAQVRLEPGTIE